MGPLVARSHPVVFFLRVIVLDWMHLREKSKHRTRLSSPSLTSPWPWMNSASARNCYIRSRGVAAIGEDQGRSAFWHGGAVAWKTACSIPWRHSNHTNLSENLYGGCVGSFVTSPIYRRDRLESIRLAAGGVC